MRAFLWGRDPKIVHLSSGLPCKFTGLAIFLRDKTFDREKENSGDYSVPYIRMFSDSPKETHPESRN